MGAWGSSLYANDTASDVRDTYMDFLQDQLSNQEAYEKTLEKLKDYMTDPDEAPLFWYALADTQWQVGRLTPDVKEKALEWIDKDGGMSLWEDSPSGGAGWQKTLDKLKAKLETEQRKEKHIRKPVTVESNLWDDGDVYAYLFHKEFDGRFGAPGKYMVLHKIGVEYEYYGDSSKTETYMIIRVFDKLFDNLPGLDDLHGIRLLPHSYPNQTQELLMQRGLMLYKKKEYPKDYLTYLGNIPVPKYTPIPHSMMRTRLLHSSASIWLNIESWSELFQLWQGKEYEIIEESIFRYTHPK